VLREHREQGVNLSFQELNDQVTRKLQRLKYNQTPNLIGQKDILKQPLPWAAGASPVPARTATTGTGPAAAGKEARTSKARRGSAKRRVGRPRK
jgi:hypothetical protein